MTISTTETRADYTASASQTLFTVPFEFYDNTDLDVYIDGTLQTLSTHYTVSGGSGSTGTITLVTPATGGEAVAIVLDLPYSRTIEYQDRGDFFADTVNEDLNKAILLIKQLKEILDRVPQFAASSTSSGLTLPEPETSKLLVWNASGNLINSTAELGQAVLPSISGNALNMLRANSGETALEYQTAAQVLAQLAAENGQWTGQQYGSVSTLTDGANISWNWNTSQVAKVTLAGNRTLDNPTNLQAGSTAILYVTQDGTGSRTLSYGSNYRFPSGTAPTLTTTASAVDILFCASIDGTNIDVISRLDFQ